MAWLLLPVTVGVGAVSAGWKEIPVLGGGSHDYTGTRLSILPLHTVVTVGVTLNTRPRKQAIGNCHPTTQPGAAALFPRQIPSQLPQPISARSTGKQPLSKLTRPAHCHAPDSVLDVSARWRGRALVTESQSDSSLIFRAKTELQTIGNLIDPSADGFAPRQKVQTNFHRPSGRSVPPDLGVCSVRTEGVRDCSEGRRRSRWSAGISRQVGGGGICWWSSLCVREGCGARIWKCWR